MQKKKRIIQILQNNHAARGDNLYRGILALGRNMGLDNTIT
jgi:hypothetical protein